MADVFEGPTDTRQSDEKIRTSRFRPRYRILDKDEVALYDAIMAKAVELEALLEQVKPGRYGSLALTALEQAVMWIIKELTA